MAPLSQIVFILVVATLCQVVAWRIKLPSILLLLIAGMLAGPALHIIAPDDLLGSTLMPLVELAVAIILFEGGLSLKKGEISKVGGTVFRLVTVAVLITWVGLATLAYLLLGTSLPVSALLGAILVISGPTVVIPLLRLIRARSPVEPILRWEGILIDPIGVILAVLVAEVCESGSAFTAPWHIVSGMLISLTIGIFFGWLGATILRIVVGRHLVPDQFTVPLSLAVLFTLVTVSNALHEQSGLLTSTVMGIVVATNKKVWVQTLEDFIGHTQGMFIGVLFVVLAARLDPIYFQDFDLSLMLFIGLAIFVVRPFAVFASTIGTDLKVTDKMAISSLAPRGIVSAALASSLGASLAASGIPGVERLIPFTFATIIVSVAIYGLFSPLLFKLFGVQQNANEGVLFVGGGRIALAIAKVVAEQGFRTIFVDTNDANIRRSRAAGIQSYQGSILSDGLREEIGFEGIGNLLAFTPNDEANSLAAVEYRHLFGAARVFQLAPIQPGGAKVGGRIFAYRGLPLEKIEDLWFNGYRPYCKTVVEKKSEEEGDVMVPRVDKPSELKEYILAEIEGKKLYIVADDKFKRPAKPDRIIVFGVPDKRPQ